MFKVFRSGRQGGCTGLSAGAACIDGPTRDSHMRKMHEGRIQPPRLQYLTFADRRRLPGPGGHRVRLGRRANRFSDRDRHCLTDQGRDHHPDYRRRAGEHSGVRQQHLLPLVQGWRVTQHLRLSHVEQRHRFHAPGIFHADRHLAMVDSTARPRQISDIGACARLCPTAESWRRLDHGNLAHRRGWSKRLSVQHFAVEPG